MRKSAWTIVIWREPLKIRCHVIVPQQRATVEQCARKFRNVSLQTEWTWVNCKLITASKGVTRLDGARGKKQVGAPTFEPEVYWKQMCCWRKYLWHGYDFSASPQWFGAQGIATLVTPLTASHHNKKRPSRPRLRLQKTVSRHVSRPRPSLESPSLLNSFNQAHNEVKIFSPPLEKYVGHSLKLLDIV